ncbi:hypothetical protein VTN31DRAFT_2000 [Thermomyces dupontii]|uniref:uncharacterized protein n=1 Tax=Talaromyces thermophilus TaxID=28565 RepID=UPI00374373B8
MGITYAEARRILNDEALQHRDGIRASSRAIPLKSSVNRIVKDGYDSPVYTPRWDTSAMDGYVLRSEETQSASEDNPVTFRVVGTVAAGDEPLIVPGDAHTCVEIMTGARFPTVLSGKPFDCCVRLEDAAVVESRENPKERLIHVSKLAKPNQHKRLVGEDFAIGSRIIDSYATVRPNHVMALASVGCTELTVLPKPRIALFSTGAELIATSDTMQHIPDTNGPYFSTVLESLGYDVEFMGIIDDNPTTAVQKILESQLQQHDIVITTGAVSAGRFDFIRQALEKLSADILFHHVAMRPGHPALFARLPESPQRRVTPFFGLPGNPVAAAACFRFLVLPYLRTLLFQQPEAPIAATLRLNDSNGIRTKDGGVQKVDFPQQADVFRAGQILPSSPPDLEVQLIQDHSPGKIRPFVDADCWIHIHRGVTSLSDGDIVHVFPMV